MSAWDVFAMIGVAVVMSAAILVGALWVAYFLERRR